MALLLFMQYSDKKKEHYCHTASNTELLSILWKSTNIKETYSSLPSSVSQWPPTGNSMWNMTHILDYSYQLVEDYVEVVPVVCTKKTERKKG
jgi:hypothetical protein